MGCFGKGCTTFVALVVLFALALFAGGYWALHHFREKYSAPQPLALSHAPTQDFEAVTEDAPTSLAADPAATAAPRVASVPADEVQARWDDFEEAADRNRPGRIELSAGEINALIQNSRNARGKASVSIQDNVGRVTVSIPLDQIRMMKGRYLNGSCTVAASPDGDPAKARISNVTIGGQRVDDSWIDQSMFGWPSVRSLITDWMAEQDIRSFRIENNRVIGETGGGSTFSR